MSRPLPLLEELIYSIIGAFFEVYNTLGYGFLEHLYLKALERELLARGHKVSREVCVSEMYKGAELGKQRLDMVIDDCIVIEIKSTYDLPRNATRQLFNYLRATDLKFGLLLHFGPDPRFFRVSRSEPERERSKSRSTSAGSHPEPRGRTHERHERNASDRARSGSSPSPRAE
jgi:GxxExxY protein